MHQYLFLLFILLSPKIRQFVSLDVVGKRPQWQLKLTDRMAESGPQWYFISARA